MAQERKWNVRFASALSKKAEASMADNTRKDPKDWVSGDDPMTGAQASYLKTLSEQAHKPDPTDRNLTKAEASELIDALRDDAGIEEVHHEQAIAAQPGGPGGGHRRPDRR
jgi:hypothetical protein